MLYRRSRQEMPAYAEEIEGALYEGVEVHTLTIPKRILGNGRVAGIETVRASLGEPDESGRRRPVPIERSETVIECDTVIAAIGQVPSTDLLTWQDGPEITKWGTVRVNPTTMQTRLAGIFAAGDCIGEGSTVIGAIAGGQRAAVNIDKFLGGAGRLPPDVGFTLTKPEEQNGATTAGRAVQKSIDLQRRRLNFHEVVLGLDDEEAVREANRCLRCDLER